MFGHFARAVLFGVVDGLILVSDEEWTPGRRVEDSFESGAASGACDVGVDNLVWTLMKHFSGLP